MKWKNTAYGTNTFFITATITEWHPIFLHEEPRRILLTDLDFYRRKYNARIYAYVLMPDHYHLIVRLEKPEDLHDWLRDVQSHSSSELSKWLRQNCNPNSLRLFISRANGKHTLTIWKKQARVIGIMNERVLHAKIKYIHANPVRRGLVSTPSEWPWSSWWNYFAEDNSLFSIDEIGE